MKKRVFKRSEKIDGSKSYIPDENLVGFLQDWLLIHQKKEQFTKDGKSLSKEDQLKIRALDKQKVDILDNMIFPALANLTYFFEAMAVSSRFSDAFADELEELLDPRKSKMMASAGSSMRMSSISFRRNNFARLIDAALDIKFEKFPDRVPGLELNHSRGVNGVTIELTHDPGFDGDIGPWAQTSSMPSIFMVEGSSYLV